MKSQRFFVVILLVLLVASSGWARRRHWHNGYPDGTESTLPKYEYSDAPGYGTARHSNGTWQTLGTAWDQETGPIYTGDASDDGVSWSTDGGATYGHEAVRTGQSVIFKFDVTRAPYGVHPYDQLKAWVDWDGDKVWDNTNELVIAEKWYKDTPEDGDTLIPDADWLAYYAAHGEGTDPDAVLSKSFYAQMVVPDDAVVGDTWLRARVSCDDTLDFEDSNPYDYMWQGEVEDWKLTVTPVPVPSAVLLAGLGLVGVRRFRRRLAI